MASEILKEYNLALHVKLSNKPEQHHVSFTAVRDLKPEAEWLALRDFDDFEELEDTDKILLLDCTSLPLSNSLATLSPKDRVLAVLCVCRTVSEQELKMSVDEMTSEGHPPLLFLLEKSPEVIKLKELLLVNPYDVECTISEEQSSSQLTTSDAYPSHKLSDDGGPETVSKGNFETMIGDTLENLLFTKEREHDLVPLVLCKNPHLFTYIVSFLHQKVTMYSPQSKKELRGILNKIAKYLKNKVIFNEHVQVDWPLYLMIFSEMNSFYDSSKDSKENQALEAMEFILDRFLKVPPDVIATSIRSFATFSQDNAFKLRKIDNLNYELIQLFNTQLFGTHKAGNKHYHLKHISKPQDLETKLLWYNVIVLCNQCFKIPGHSRWFEYILQYVEYDQLSVFESSTLNSIRVYGIEFGLKLGLSFEQRFLLSTLMRWVSASIISFTFHNFNTVLEFILRWEYEVTEIVDFISSYLLFITEFIRSKKSTFDYLLQENPKASVHIMCIIMSNLATLTCTASTRDVQEINKKSSLEVCRKYWLDIFKIILSNIIHYFQDKLYNPEEFALLMRNFYDLIKIPTSPESLIKPWIREYKKEVIAMVVKQSHRYDIAMFHEILRRFSVNLLSRIAIYEYFMKFHPSSKVDLKDAIWDDLLRTIFAIKDPPKSIFVTLKRIFEQYILRNSGYEFIRDCLSFDLPAYGKEYVPTEKEDKQIPSFMSVVERECRQSLRFKVHENLLHLLDLIPKLRFPSLLHVTILDPLCRAIVPDQSLLSSPDKLRYCKSLIISLETISHHQTQQLTLEQLKTSNEHYYLWKILSVISRGLRFDRLEYSKFPYMVITLLFIYDKFNQKFHGFGDYAWEDKNLNNFIEYCKRSSSIVHKQHERITQGDCTLLEYTEIVNNLQNLNQLFKNCHLPTIDTEVIQEKMKTFAAITEEMRTILFLQLEIENEMKFRYLPVFLEENQTNVPEGIRREIEMLFSIHHAQHINKQKKIVSIPSITPSEVILLNDFNGRCQIVIDSFKMFSLPLFENSKSSVHEFLAHFALRENVLFTACLHKCQQDKLSSLKGDNSVPYLSMDQFVQCLTDCYQLLTRICEGKSTYSEIENINQSLKLESLDFTKIQADINKFAPLGEQMGGELGVMDLFQLLKIAEYLHHITDVCEQYKLTSCIESEDYKQLQEIVGEMRNEQYRNNLTISMASSILAKVSAVTNNMPIQRYLLFPILTESGEFYRFLREKKLHENRESFDNQVNLITSEKQDEDYDDTVLSHLSIAFIYMLPLFEKDWSLKQFLKHYSSMNIGSETGYSQLKTVNNNIMLIRRWFILAEGETTENVSQQLQDILETGKYEIVLGNPDRERDLESMPSLPNSNLKIRKQSPSILLKYSASTKIAALHQNRRGEPYLPHPVPSSPTLLNANPPTFKAALSRIEERMNTDKIDEFVRKLGFLEQSKLSERRIANIADFQHFHNTMRKLFEVYLELTSLGHPQYQENVTAIPCSTTKDRLKEIFDDSATKLTQWKERYTLIQQNTKYLLFFPIQRIITTVSLMEAKAWNRAANQVSFLFNHDFRILRMIKTNLMDSFNTVKKQLEDSHTLVSPAEVMSSIITILVKDKDLKEELLIQDKASTAKPTRRDMRDMAGTMIVLPQTIQRAYGFSQSDVLSLIQSIYQNKKIDSFQLLHCNANTSFEELSLFLDRTTVFTNCVYSLIEVNKLPNLLQEHTMKHIAESQKPSQSIAQIHYIETAQSLLHELPGVKVNVFTKPDKLNPFPPSLVFDKIELVYGLEGNGKTHYIRNMIKDSPHLVISINEAFSVPAIIEKMNQNIILNDARGLCIYFNFTITCLLQEDKASKDYSEYLELMSKVNWFFFDFLVLNHISDSSSSLIFRVPAGMNWKLYIEVPSRPASLLGREAGSEASAKNEDPRNNLSEFQLEIPIFKTIGKHKEIGYELPYELDTDVQLICKYLKAYYDFEMTKDKGTKCKGINRLYDEKKRIPVRFSAEKDLNETECSFLLGRYMEKHVQTRKILQKLFVRYMLRRCNVLEHLPYFTFNTGTGIIFDNERQVYTNTKQLGSTLMRIMIFEVNKFCDPSCKEDWSVHEHQQLIYNTSGGGHTIKFLSLNPNRLDAELRKDFKTLGIIVPNFKELGSRSKLEELLAHALSLESTDSISELINEEEYVLTVDFLLKMLNIHERRMCRYPVVIVGETGVGKTKLLEFLSKLWNKTIHRAYYKTVDAIIDIIKKNIDQILFSGPNQPESGNLGALISLNEAISLRRQPPEDSVLKACEILYQDFSRPLETFCRMPAFNLFLIDHHIAETAIRFQSPENTSRFLIALLSAKPIETFIKINVHSALTPTDIKCKFNEIFEKAELLSKPLIPSERPIDHTSQVPIVTVFLDEINTSSCLGLFKEIVIDGYIDGEKIPDNVFIVAACNPHRSVTATLQVDTKVEDWVLGWYYVRKLHPTLSRILWDYGALNKHQEHEYIQQKFCVSHIQQKIKGIDLSNISAQIAKAQKLVRKFAKSQLIKVGFGKEEAEIRSKSCVSQRDIQRVFKITDFLNSIRREEINDERTELDITQESVIVAIGLVYYFRLDEHFRKEFSTKLDTKFGLRFVGILNNYVDEFVNVVKIPPGIAKTKALKENLFATLICTMSKIPLIIVGAPGTSKTLSFNLAISNIKGAESPKEYFRNPKFPALEPHYYQCSRRSTSTEIENVFKIAIKRQETHDEAELKVFSVVFMDEAGLPEESHESLKALHYFLDRPKVSFVAISNHILDAAKSNRAINLFRPQQQDDLLTLAQGCFLKSTKSFDHTTPSRQFISRICAPYENLMNKAVYSKFYGLRDFIHMIGYLRRNRDHQNEKYLLRAVERNFNGQDKSCFKKVATEFVTEEVYCENARTIIEILRESLADRSIRPQTRKSKDGEEEELVEVRYKMIIDPSEDDSLTRLLYHYNILNIEDTRLFIGSDFPGDGELQKVILISAIKHAASEGKTVILSQADEIYENFYDLFNQNYKQVEDEKGRRYYANIAIGSHSKPCRVDPNFQCIVHLHKSFLKDAPQPFLNRFEKFHVSQDDLLQASIDALPPCMKIIVKSAINQVRNFIRAVKIETFYGNIDDSFESLLIDMLPKPGFDYEAIKKKLKSMGPSEPNESLDPDAMHDDDDDAEDDMNKPYPPSHQYLDLMLSQLKKLAGFNFIYLPVEERNKIAVDILSTASKIEPESNSEVENLSKVIRANPQNIEQFLSDAIELLMKENGPMDEDVAQEKSLYLLPLRVLPGERLVIGMIVHFLIRYLCVRLLQLALPEALIVKFDQLSHTFKQTYLVHQDHFEFKKLVSKYVELQDESRDMDLTRPTKLICYTRTTSFILSLPNEYTSTFNPSISSTVHADVEELIPMAGESRAESNTSLFKLSAIKTQDQFMTILRDFFNHPTKRVLLFIADMQHITQQRINFVRIMIDEEESVAGTKIGADYSLNKLVVILLHYPPTIFNRTPLKTGTTSLSRYPAHFLHGWDHCYLDNLQKSKENSPLSIQEWLSLTLLDQRDRLKSIERTMLKSLTDKLPTLTDNILSRIIFGTSVHCVFNSDSLTHNDRSKLMESIFVETDIYQIMCEMFTTYFDYTFIQKQIHSYSNSIFQNLSNLSLSDLVVTSFWNLFTSFLTLMTYKINEGLNLEVLFDHSIQGMEFNQENVKLFEDILRLISKPSIEEIENISHILDSQVKKVVHLPKFPFSSYIVRAFDNAIQSSIQEVNKNMTINTTKAKSSQGANKPGSEDLNKLLIENLVSNIDKYPLIKFTMSIVDQNLWLSYLEDFAYSHLSFSSTSQLWKQEHSNNFIVLIRFWGYDFDQKDIANSLLKLHVSSFSNPPDFSKLLFIFSSLERLSNQTELLESIKNPNMMSVMHGEQRSLPLYSYFITMLYDSVVKISVRPTPENMNKFKSWVSVYLNLIIQLSGSSQPDALDYNLPEDQKFMSTLIHSLYLVAKYHHISPEFLKNAFDLAIFVRLQPKGKFELIPVFNKGLEQITHTCQDIKRPEITKELKTEFAEGVLHHHIEVNRQIDEKLICWILRSANTQFVWSGSAVKHLSHPHSKVSKETKGGSDQLIEPGLLTFRSFQYLITRFLTNASDQEEGEKSNDITLFNKQVKHLIASELLSAHPVKVPSEYIPFYYDLGGKFMKCSAEMQPTMKQPLAHLYYHIALDRLIQLHGEKELVNIFKTFTELIGTNLGYELSPEETVISRIEKQALFQVILRSYSKQFKPNPSSTVLHYIERNPDCIVEIQKHIDDHNFGGGALGGHSWTMLYLVSKKCLSMEIFENYLEQLKLSKDELPWLYKCISKLERIEREKTPQFPFVTSIKDKRYKSYKECYELMRYIASTDSADEAGRKIDELSNLVEKSQEMPYLRLYIWLGVYQEFYLKGISSELLCQAIDSKRFKTLELSEGKKRILFAFLNPQRMVRSMEQSEPLNPDTPVYEMQGAKLHLKERTGEKKDYLFEFFSLDQKDPDDVFLRNILSNLIAVFIALPNDTTHLSAFFLNTETLRDTYVVSNLYPKPISQAIRYDCGCELNEDGSYGRPDYYSFDRKSFTLHSFYLMTLMNFGALSVNLISQPNASESVSSALFSEWKPVRHYCVSQIRTIWLHMQLRWQLTQEELGEFLTNCFYDFYKLALEPASPLQPTLFKSTKEVLVYESFIHRRVYEENLRRIRELRADVRTAGQQQVISEFSCNVISFRKWYPPEITFSHLQHTIESCRPVDTEPGASVNTFAILHRFISERKRFRISSILIPNLIKLYRIFHTNLSFFITRKDAETKTIDQVISKIKEKCKLFFNVDIQNLYERIHHFYNEYVKVCRGLIGFGPCAAIRREEKFGPLKDDTKFIRLLSLSEEPEVGSDALYLVIHDLITTQNEFLETVAENSKTLPWLRSLELETSTITPTEENTRNAFVSDLTPNEINHYWTSMDKINENSLEIFELIRSRTTYTPFQERDTCPYDLNALEQDIFWKYIASKPMFSTQSTLKHKLFRFKEIIVSNIPDPLNLQQFLTQMKNYLSDQSEEYLTLLSDATVKNLEYHFHTLEYRDFCRLLNALRQTLQRLAQNSIMMSKEDNELNMDLAAFLMQHASKELNPRETLVNAGFIEFSSQQLHILGGDIKVNTVFSCMKFFLNKFNSRSYDYCKLPYCVKTPLDAECAARIEQLGTQLTDKLRSIDVAKKELEQLLTTLQHCEQTFIQTPQEFIKKTLTDYQFYDATDEVIQLFPDEIQNAHYVSLIGSLQSCMIQINSKLAERLEQRKTATNEWREHIKDFWSLLPHFCESDAVEGDVADSFDYDVIQSQPEFSLDIAQRSDAQVLKSGGREEEGEPNYQAEGGASYDYGIL